MPRKRKYPAVLFLIISFFLLFILGSTSASGLYRRKIRKKSLEQEENNHNLKPVTQLPEDKTNKRIKRDANAVTAEFSANKQIQVVTGSGNPEAFSISVNGNANTSVYDVTLVEDITGLTVLQYVIPSQNSLTILPSTVQYNAGNLTGSDSLEFSYLATLSNLGSDVSIIHRITTSISYFISPQLNANDQRTLALDVCIEKVLNVIKEPCNWCGCIIIVIICFLIGVLLALIAAIVWMVCHSPSSNVTPLAQRELKPSSKNKKLSQKHDEITFVDVIMMTDENEIRLSLESLELQRLLWLEEEINSERRKTTDYLFQVISSRRESQSDEISNEGLIQETKIDEISNETSWTEKIENLLIKHEDFDGEVKRKEEIDEWRNKSENFDDEYQLEMTSLIEERHCCDVVNERFLNDLKNVLEGCQAMLTDDDEFEKVLKKKMERLHSSDIKKQFSDVESLYLDELVRVFYENVARLQKITKTRAEKVEKIVEDFKKEELIWEEMTSQNKEILEAAQKQKKISQQTAKEIDFKQEKENKRIKESFDKEVNKAKEQIAKNYHSSYVKLRHASRGHDNYDVSNDNDDTKFLSRQVEKLNAKLENEMKIQMELDEFAYEYENLFSAAVSQTRKQIKKTKDFLKELLIHQDVGEDWIENMFSKKRDELMNYLDEVDEITVASLAPPLRSMTSKFQDVLEEVQIRVERCQIAGAITEKMALLEQKNTRKKNILTRTIAEYVTKRYSDVASELKEKREAVTKIKTKKEEAGIRKELQKKLAVMKQGPKIKKKKLNVRYKRYQSIASRVEAQDTLSNQLLGYFKQMDNETGVSRDRSAFEELTMTLLQLMTSSGKLTSRDCRQILERFRYQRNELKRRYTLERKRREEELKRKTENLVLKRKYESLETTFGNTNAIESLLYHSDDVMKTSLRLANDERSSVQKLFQTRRQIKMEEEDSLIKQEVDIIRQLLMLVEISPEEIRDSIRILLPNKDGDYIQELNEAICDRESKKLQSNALKGQLLTKVYQLTQKKHMENLKSTKPSKHTRGFQTKNLDSLPSVTELKYPGTRPEPLGRTSTPDYYHK